MQVQLIQRSNSNVFYNAMDQLAAANPEDFQQADYFQQALLQRNLEQPEEAILYE